MSIVQVERLTMLSHVNPALAPIGASSSLQQHNSLTKTVATYGGFNHFT